MGLDGVKNRNLNSHAWAPVKVASIYTRILYKNMYISHLCCTLKHLHKPLRPLPTPSPLHLRVEVLQFQRKSYAYCSVYPPPQSGFHFQARTHGDCTELPISLLEQTVQCSPFCFIRLHVSLSYKIKALQDSNIFLQISVFGEICRYI